MTDKIAPRELLEKGSGEISPREMIGFAAQQLMELDAGTSTRRQTIGLIPVSHTLIYRTASAAASAATPPLSSAPNRFGGPLIGPGYRGCFARNTGATHCQNHDASAA